MQVPAVRLAATLKQFLAYKFGSDIGYGSNEEAALAAVRLLETHVGSGVPQIRHRLSRLVALLDSASHALSLPLLAPDLARKVAELRGRAATSCLDCTLESLRLEETELLSLLSCVCDKLVADPRLGAAERHRAALEIATWDSARLAEHAGCAAIIAEETGTTITQERLRAYLSDRFADPGLDVTQFSQVSGGFGKETYCFSAAGRQIQGDFVLRRDRAQPLIDNDCHRVANEYPLVRALFDAGFPAAEALWLDTLHSALPGGHFFVMRRSSGRAGGDVFGSSFKLPHETVRVLAQTIASLHRLPALIQLGDLTESLHTQLWSMPMSEVTHRYISGYCDYFLAQMESPPSITTLYGWLLSNIPADQGKPVLVHGDLGLQNLLFEDGRLNVVLDWELAHVGDPAEDIAYVRNTANTSLDWDTFRAAYQRASGPEISLERLHFFQVWGHVRNATAAALAANCYASGKLDDFNIAHMGFFYVPRFVDAAVQLIATGPTL